MKKWVATVMMVVGVSGLALADQASVEITIKNHQFSPAEVKIPANTRVKLIVSNEDATAEEFEGEDFKAEKVIAGNSKATIMVGPFKPGRYEFVGEFHEDTAKGELVVE
ncbi:MAG: cupredoxin domain-containing protein [Gammaproteobacteria bacterium]|nr:MAG: cupredoxin domain-containing protein [Gammaproteobacteria bacterium]